LFFRQNCVSGIPCSQARQLAELGLPVQPWQKVFSVQYDCPAVDVVLPVGQSLQVTIVAVLKRPMAHGTHVPPAASSPVLHLTGQAAAAVAQDVTTPAALLQGTCGEGHVIGQVKPVG
jgi:hypothetical protein